MHHALAGGSGLGAWGWRFGGSGHGVGSELPGRLSILALTGGGPGQWVAGSDSREVQLWAVS